MSGNHSETLIQAVVANRRGEIFDLEGYGAVGMDGPVLTPLSTNETTVMPHGGELMFLPDRVPVVFNQDSGAIEQLPENPYQPGEEIFPVAAFNSPGYVISHTCAYQELPHVTPLPLFSYGAVGFHGEGFRTAVIRVDKEPRQDLRQMKPAKVSAGVKQMRKKLPQNRLRRHLEKCALAYGCPAGKNFFLGRYEAPLPTARTCNARCLGCISLQQDSGIPNSQDRIDFTPTPEEIAQVALAHIERVNASVVSFGQGCEGDPLFAADIIEPAIRAIRRSTSAGTINMNTNGSLPHVMEKLFNAGLDSIRISMNSLQPGCYHTYFRPNGYEFEHVLDTIGLALSKDKHVAINYLNCPGFTDTPEEAAALESFMKRHPIHMIQWRNLNFDPFQYLHIMNEAVPLGEPMGVRRLMNRIRNRFPHLRFGYFNPPKEKWSFETPRKEEKPT